MSSSESESESESEEWKERLRKSKLTMELIRYLNKRRPFCEEEHKWDEILTCTEVPQDLAIDSGDLEDVRAIAVRLRQKAEDIRQRLLNQSDHQEDEINPDSRPSSSSSARSVISNSSMEYGCRSVTSTYSMDFGELRVNTPFHPNIVPTDTILKTNKDVPIKKLGSNIKFTQIYTKEYYASWRERRMKRESFSQDMVSRNKEEVMLESPNPNEMNDLNSHVEESKSPDIMTDFEGQFENVPRRHKIVKHKCGQKGCQIITVMPAPDCDLDPYEPVIQGTQFGHRDFNDRENDSKSGYTTRHHVTLPGLQNPRYRASGTGRQLGHTGSNSLENQNERGYVKAHQGALPRLRNPRFKKLDPAVTQAFCRENFGGERESRNRYARIPRLPNPRLSGPRRNIATRLKGFFRRQFEKIGEKFQSINCCS